MKYTFQYDTIEDRDKLITEHSDKTLIEDANIIDGNFLVFSDDPENDTKQQIFINIPEEEFQNIKERQDATDAAVLQLLMEGMM